MKRDASLLSFSSIGIIDSFAPIFFSALRTFKKCGCLELPVVGTSLVTSCLRYLSLRYCHSYTSRELLVSLQVILYVIFFHLSSSFESFASLDSIIGAM